MQDVTEQRLTERELHAHYAVSQALREWESFEHGVVDLLRRIAAALDYPMAALWLWDATVDALGCRAFWTAPGVDPGDFEEVIRGIHFGDGEGKPGLAWQTREPVVTADVATIPPSRCARRRSRAGWPRRSRSPPSARTGPSRCSRSTRSSAARGVRSSCAR